MKRAFTKFRIAYLILFVALIVGFISLGYNRQLQTAARSQQTQAVQIGPALDLGCPNPYLTTTVFYTNTTTFNYAGGPVILSSTADGTGAITTDDEVKIEITRPDGSQAVFSYVFGYPRNSNAVDTLPPQDITGFFQVGTNNIRITYIDNSLCATS